MFRPGRRPLRAMAALLTILFVLLLAVASSEQFHGLIHQDAGQASHHCAITFLSHGQVEHAVGYVAAPAPPLAWHFAPVFETSVVVTTVELLPPGRAPPAIFC